MRTSYSLPISRRGVATDIAEDFKQGAMDISAPAAATGFLKTIGIRIYTTRKEI